ncbi:MAG: hypothetical protein AMXMBFR84_33890 [Candidatus Hydrogenedentota bacterium]
MQRRILMVGGGRNQLGMVRKAREMGLYCVVADGAEDAPSYALADATAVADITNADALMEAARQHRVSAIYPAAEWGVVAAARAAAELGLPGTPVEAAVRARDKHAMRQALHRAGMTTPAFAGAATLEEAQRAAREIGLPLITKPGDGNASRGVTKVDYFEDLPLAFSHAQKNSRTGLVLVESFMAGEEFHVDGIVFEGRYTLGGMTGKVRSRPPHCFDIGIYMPPYFDKATEQAIVETTDRALRAIGFTHGATHVEVILTDSGPQIVEIAGRPGGARIPTDLIPMTYGMDYTADTIRIALGEAPREHWQYEHGTALYWIPSQSGVVTEVTGEASARTLPGVTELIVHAQPGQTIRHLIDCVTRDQIGYVLTYAPSVREAVAVAEEALAKVHVHTSPTVVPAAER